MAAVASLVTAIVPEPYMDEAFHARMAGHYCRGELSPPWDPLITTPPGLYLLSSPLAAAATALARRGVAVPATGAACTLLSLRLTSSLAWGASLGLTASILRATHPRLSPWGAAARAFALVSHPVHAFFGAMFYTDAAAVALLLVTHLLLLPRESRTRVPEPRTRVLAAAVAAASAIGVRQTSAVWVAFFVADAVLRRLGMSDSRMPDSRITDSGISDSGVSDSSPGLLAAVRAAWAARAPLAAEFWPLGLVLAAFSAFVAANGGVALGDKAAHAPAAHWAMLGYAATAAAASLLPLLCRTRESRTRDSVTRVPSTRGMARYGRHAARYGALCLASLAAVQWGTVAHAYLLADNRHLAFYAWRRVLSPSPWVPFAWAPVHAAAAFALWSAARRRRSVAWTAAYVVCAAAALVPAGLLEPRYFTPGFLVLGMQLMSDEAPAWAVGAVAGVHVVGASAAWALFLGRPFRWPDGSLQRFMF